MIFICKILSLLKTLVCFLDFVSTSVDFLKGKSSLVTFTTTKKKRKRSSRWRCSIKNLFKILQYSEENVCARVPFLIHLRAYNFIKKRLQHRCLPENIAKFLEIRILKNICKWLHLEKAPGKVNKLNFVNNKDWDLEFSLGFEFFFSFFHFLFSWTWIVHSFVHWVHLLFMSGFLFVYILQKYQSLT